MVTNPVHHFVPYFGTLLFRSVHVWLDSLQGYISDFILFEAGFKSDFLFHPLHFLITWIVHEPDARSTVAPVGLKKDTFTAFAADTYP